MATVTISRSFTVRSPVTLTATKANPTGFFVNFKNGYAVIEIEFLDDSDNVLDQEIWAIRGEELDTALGRANQANTALEEIEATLDSIISFAENTTGAKQALIDLGKLSISKGSIVNGTRPLVQKLGS